MLVVTGTQRSGTSVVAKMLSKEGYMEESFWDEGVNGGLDDSFIAGFYREYLGDSRFPFVDFPGIPDPLPTPEQFGKMDREVVKFCYLLMNPTFTSIWRKFRPPSLGDTFLIMSRESDKVCRSKERYERTFQKDSTLLKQSSSTLAGNRLASLNYLVGYHLRVIRFDVLFEEAGLSRLNYVLWKLKPGVRVTEEVFRDTLDINLKHF